MRPTAFGGNRLGVVALWCLPALTFLIPVACGLAAFGARNPVLGAVLVATGVAAALATRPRLASSVSPSRIDAVELDLAEHPRVRDALHRAALAARQPAPTALWVDHGFTLHRSHADPHALVVGYPLLTLLSVDQFVALLAFEMSRSAKDRVQTGLDHRATTGGALARWQAQLYASVASRGEGSPDARGRAASARVASPEDLDRGLAIMAEAARGIDLPPYLTLFDEARARAPLSEAVRHLATARTQLPLPAAPTSSLLARAEQSLLGLEEGFFAPAFPLTDWSDVAALAAPSQRWNNLTESLVEGETPTPRSLLDRGELPAARDLRVTAYAALGASVTGIDWAARGDFFVIWDEPEGLDAAIAAAQAQGSTAPLTAFLLDAGGDLDAVLTPNLGDAYLGALCHLEATGAPAEATIIDVHVFADGLLVLPVDPAHGPLSRARYAARTPRGDLWARPGAQWFPGRDLADAERVRSLEVTLHSGTHVSATPTPATTYYPYEHTIDRALAVMLLRGGVPWARVAQNLML